MAIDFMKPVKTRDGRDVRILCVDGPGLWPVVGIVETWVTCWGVDGRSSSVSGDFNYDLVQAPVRKSAWMAIDRLHDLYETEFDARHYGPAGARYVEVHWEE